MLSSHQKESINWLFGSILTALCLATATHFWQTGELIPRGPASLLNPKPFEPEKIDTKKEILRDVKVHDQHRHGKGSGSLQIEIQKVAGHAESGAPLEIEANIQALQNLEALEYTWLLPAGVQALSGSIEGNLGTLVNGQSTKLSLTVSASARDNKQIHLHVFRRVNDEVVGQMTQFNTLDQEKINAAIKKKAEILGQHEENGEALKIVQ